ncbi:TPA: hypothetical protein ACGCO1_002045 [Legionella pneumophila]
MAILKLNWWPFAISMHEKYSSYSALILTTTLWTRTIGLLFISKVKETIRQSSFELTSTQYYPPALNAPVL